MIKTKFLINEMFKIESHVNLRMKNYASHLSNQDERNAFFDSKLPYPNREEPLIGSTLCLMGDGPVFPIALLSRVNVMQQMLGPHT